MSRLSLFLLLSGCANLVVLAALVRRAAAPSAPPAASVTAVEAIRPARPPGPPTLAAAWADVIGTDLDPASPAFASADSDRDLLARLRAAGFPASALRAIFKYRIDQRFSAREAALRAAQPPPVYWRSTSGYNLGDNDSPDTRAAFRALRREKAAALRDLLGDDAESALAASERQRRFGPLSAAKATQLEDLLADYSDMRRGLQINGPPLPADREQIALLEAERDRDLAALLTPEELAAYQLRADATASRLQRSLTDFPTTEAEYVALHDLSADFDTKWGRSTGGLTREQRTERTAEEKQVQAAIADLLGPERYADYKIKSDNQYQPLKALAEQLELPVENITPVIIAHQTYQEQRSAIYRDRSLSVDQRNAKLEELQTQIRAQVSAALTPAGAAAYERTLGSWIGYIVPRPPPGS